MARGLIIGQILKSGSLIEGCQVSLTAVRGNNINGSTLIQYTVPYKEMEVGGWFKTKFNTASRKTVSGAFAIPFSWDHWNANNYARVAGNDVIKIKVTAIIDDNSLRNFEGEARLVPDAIQLLQWIKMGKSLQNGTNQEMLKGLTKEMRNAITGKEFDGIPYSAMSNEPMMILGIMPKLLW